MEIFQTLWTALTTENEFLTNTLLLPICFIESLVNVLLFTTLLNITTAQERKTKYIIFISLAFY